MKNTVASGTLRYGSDWDSTYWVTGKRKGRGNKFNFVNSNGKTFQMPVAGKTGTTQNWADAWAVGFTPYYTSVFWFGFDKPGQSLGLQLTGSTLSGYAWADYMKKVHNGLPMKEFSKPATGVIEATVCSVSGGILTPECGNHKVTAWYLEGTQPTQVCSVHSTANSSRTIGIYRLEKELYKAGFASELIIRDNSTLSFNLDKPLQSGDFGVFDTKLSPTDSQELDENGAAPNYNYLMD